MVGFPLYGMAYSLCVFSLFYSLVPFCYLLLKRQSNIGVDFLLLKRERWAIKLQSQNSPSNWTSKLRCHIKNSNGSCTLVSRQSRWLRGSVVPGKERLGSM